MEQKSKEEMLRLRISTKLKDELKKYADREAMTVSEVVRYLIRREIEN